jgi:hypothetical protein
LWFAAQRMGQTGVEGVQGKQKLPAETMKDIDSYEANVRVLREWYIKGDHLTDDWLASKHLVAI